MVEYYVYYEESLIDIVYYEDCYNGLQVLTSLIYNYNHDVCIKIERTG